MNQCVHAGVKRPLSAYQCFVKEVHARGEVDSKLSFGDRSREIAAKWASKSAAERAPYDALHDFDVER